MKLTALSEGTGLVKSQEERFFISIIVGDRESDIYAQFVRVPPGADLIVRAAQNRKLDNDERLFDAPYDWREFGIMDVNVPPRRPGEAARIAQVSVKAGRVCLAKPGNGADPSDPATVTLTYVEVCETKPPKGHKAIIWRLLTTLPVCGQADEFAAAQEIVRLYRLRWRIERKRPAKLSITHIFPVSR